MIPVDIARADVAGQMNSFFQDAGGAANVTGPSAYQGQSAGYYSMGNVWTRFPQKSVQPLNLQMPSVRAGCGGIDIFTGDDGTAMESMLVGGKGDISVTANVAPRLMHEMCEAAIAGDRQKAEMLNVPLERIFSTLSTFLGSQYVNDINLNLSFASQ